MKRALLALAFLTALSGTAIAAPHTGRAWLYGNVTTQLSPNLSFTFLPGLRYEFARSGEQDPRDLYLAELFVGPNFVHRSGNLIFRGSLWYYYTGFWLNRDDSYNYTHSIEVVPAVDYRIGRFTISDRVILHNTIYAGVYGESSQRLGYGLVLRQLLQVRFQATERMGIIVGDEPFFGVIEDGDTNGDVPADPRGFWRRGFRLNRVYLGLDLKPSPTSRWTFVPMYVLESTMKPNDGGSLAETGHYFFFTVALGVPLFQPK